MSALVEPSLKVERKLCPPPSRFFTGRMDVLHMMNEYFSADSTNTQLTFVLCGMGGSGKSEIMRKFVADSRVGMDNHLCR